MSRRDNWEAEDGMGFAGLVPTLQEKREEQARNRDAETIRTQSAELAALRAQVERVRALRDDYEQSTDDECVCVTCEETRSIVKFMDDALAPPQPVAKETKP